MERTICEFNQLTCGIILSSILIVAGQDMIITKNKEGEFPPYQWYVSIRKKEQGNCST
jgi:hypothetical protein